MRARLRVLVLVLVLVGGVGSEALAENTGPAHFNGVPVLSHRPKGWMAPEVKRKIPKKGWRTGGGVVLDSSSGQILLVLNIKEKKKRGTNGWTFPKGKDEGKGPGIAARHEVLEEGGVHAMALMHLGVYKDRSWGKGRPINRHYYLMKLERDTGVFDHETAEVKWVSFEKAAKMLQQSRDRSILQQAGRALRALGDEEAPSP